MQNKKKNKMRNKEQITNKLVPVRGCGYKVYGLDGGLIGYKGDHSGEGFHYKDLDAVEKRAGVCYIPEWAFLHDYNLGETEKDGYDSIIPVDAPNNVLVKFDDAKGAIAVDWQEEYKLTDKQLDYLAECLFDFAEWASLSTYVIDFHTRIEDAIIADNKGVFTEFQKEAVMNDYTPLEYGDRDPYMSEFAQWGEEFSNAFISKDKWDEEEDYDESLAQYIDERKTGEVKTPKEFAEEWGKEKYLV